MKRYTFGSRAPPEPTGAAYSAPSDPLAGFRGERRDGEGRDRPVHVLVASAAYVHAAVADLLLWASLAGDIV